MDYLFCNNQKTIIQQVGSAHQCMCQAFPTTSLSESATCVALAQLPGKPHVLWHDGDTLVMECAHVRGLKGVSELCFRRLLLSEHCCSRASCLWLLQVSDCNFFNQPLKRSLPEQEISRFLESLNLLQCNSS